ncbi:hypothetical protein Tdes44962_MAKER08197 [Teratosphaeria destructans]|uniref:Uncharacterized protein n=1 Tax=Teratosphaeria destructans TaxID=418781 RepID=A0A9W7W594_9PEZI|nr:hypothetical protein Tdes44962_MAKER08197 [Teratosphaeria destructans]
MAAVEYRSADYYLTQEGDGGDGVDRSDGGRRNPSTKQSKHIMNVRRLTDGVATSSGRSIR